MTDVARRAGRRLRRSLAGVRRPRVSVVVVLRGRADALPGCLEGLLASEERLEVLLAHAPDDLEAGRAAEVAARRHAPRVVCAGARPTPRSGGRRGTGEWLDAAVAAARGDYLAFAPAEDVVPPGALAALRAALDRSGSDVALGVHVDVRGDRRRRVPWADRLHDVRGVRLEDRPDLVVDLAPTGKLFRLERWRGTGARLASWAGAPADVARLLLSARGVDVVDAVAHERHDRQTSLPVRSQDRFRADVLAERWSAWSEVETVLASAPGTVREAWQVALLEHLLPPLYVDAVGGGPPYAAVLQARTADLLGRVPAPVLARVPLEARLGAWSAGHGSLDDVALVQDHLADHPHGLPTVTGPEGVLAAPVTGLSATPPAPWRRVEDVDRRLRSRVTLTGTAGDGPVELTGAAFLEYVPDAGPPTVRIGGREVPVHQHAAPDLDAWAARAHEDHDGCGFTAALDRDHLPGSGPWTVTVAVGGREHRHRVAAPAAEPPAAVVLSGLRLEGAELRAEVRGDGPCRLRLTGTKASVAAATVGPAPGMRLSLPLAAEQLGEVALLPSGAYQLEVRSEQGRPLDARVEGPHALELVGERIRLQVRPAGTGPAAALVTVASPPGLPDRSARGQQRLLDGTYRAGRRLPRAERPTVLLETFRGRSAGDNPGAVGRNLLARGATTSAGEPPDVAVVVDDPAVVVPPGARAVVRRTRAWYDALATSAAYVANAGAPYWFEKAPGQLHVQTWHGTPLKRIGEDRGPGDFSTWRHRRRIADQARGWDAMVSPSPYVSRIYRSAFGFTGTVLEVGYPRNDVLLSAHAGRVREQVRARLRLGSGDRVVLYAPTWRQYVGVRDAKPLYLDAEALVAAVPDAVVLVRGHYNSTTEDDVFPAHPRIHDVTRYPDIADLFLAADALVTDYSSVMFDFVLTDRPVVLLVPDLDQYRDVERGFYFDIESRSPGPLVSTTADVVDVLTGTDTAAERRAAFRDEFCPFEDGSAAARVVEYCLNRLRATSSSATPTERSP